MAGAVHILGVRHHGPGSARSIAAALEAVRPDAVLVEGPPDGQGVLEMAAADGMTPPVALLVYDTERPSDAAYYPFAEFSPEWVAVRWGLAKKAAVRLIDLPFANRAVKGERAEGGDEGGAVDPLDELARAAGMSDGEVWWGRLIEERRGDGDALGVFGAIAGAMGAVRAAMGERDEEDGPRREAHMRRAIRGALAEGFERVAVVCGAWHAPELSEEAIKRHGAKGDEALLKGLPKRKTAATWVPWTYSRLARFSGYGAGVVSPGWYEHLWVHHESGAQKLGVAWMARVARLMRDEGLEASPGHIVEAVRLADSLAAVRGRGAVGLDELNEATLSVVCHGNAMPLRVISAKLIVGERMGAVPAEAPSVPLARDLAAQQKSLRMKVSAEEAVLDLDQRKEIDLERSRLLHRLAILGVEWGKLHDNQKQKGSTFHEVWTVQWAPELEVAVIEAAAWGNTVEGAARACIASKAATERELPKLTEMIEHVMLADLPGAVGAVMGRVGALAAVGADMGHLMRAVPPLSRVMRYGNVRKTDAALVEPVVEGLVVRVCAGLGAACASLGDDAAAEMVADVNGVHGALATLDRGDLTGMWRERLGAIGDADVHGLVAGRAWRLLMEGGADAGDVGKRMSLALSRGNDAGKASAWLEGFLSGSGSVMIHDAGLRGIVDAWVCGLTGEAFELAAPIVRRTFATFEKAERRQIGEAVKRGGGGVGGAAEQEEQGYDAARGELVMPVLRLILGEDAG